MKDLEELMSQLSPRERQICEALKQNPSLTLRGIGTTLGVSHHTVNNHLRRVYEKTGVNNKTALVANLCRSDNKS